MVWNIDDYNTPQSYEPKTEWETKLHDLTWTFDDDLPRFRHEQWRHVFDEQIKKTPLSLVVPSDQLFSLPLGEHDEKFEVRLSKEQVWERYNTLSHIARLEGAMREVSDVFASVQARTDPSQRTYQLFMSAIDAPDVETDENGDVAVHGTTPIVWTGKIPTEGREDLTGVETP